MDFTIPCDQHKGHLRFFRFANLEADFFIAQVRFSSKAGSLELRHNGGRVITLIVGDVHHGGLHRRKPGRKGAAVMLDQDAEKALDGCASGKAYFITNDEPTLLWGWINQLLSALGERPIEKQISLRTASAVGAVCEMLWRVFPMKGEPPMTRFVAAELAKDHWFNISAAKRDLNYRPRISMAEGTIELITHLKKQAGLAQAAQSPAPFPPTNRTA